MPSVTYKRKVIARNVLITVVPLTDALGTLTEGTAHMLTGRAGRITLSRRNNTEEISGNDSLLENHVRIKRGWRLGLEEIKHVDGPDLEDLVDAHDFLKVTVGSLRKGTSTDGSKDRVYYGIIEEDSWTVEPGKNIDSVSLLPIDITPTANPLITLPT
jgi:hypothetical protein